jgi:hypothetical protein
MKTRFIVVGAAGLALGVAAYLNTSTTPAVETAQEEDIQPVLADPSRVAMAHYWAEKLVSIECLKHDELHVAATYDIETGARLTVGYCVSYPRPAKGAVTVAPFDEALYLRVEADTARRMDALHRHTRVDYTAQLVTASRYTH